MEKLLKQEDVTESGIIWVEGFEDSDTKQFIDTCYSQFYANPYKPIIIYINSYGGSVHNLFSMLDTMDAIRAMASKSFYFITVASGKAASAGALLLSYGDYRFAAPNSSIMIHQIQSGTWGSHPENKVEFFESERLNKRILNILHKNCKLSIKLDVFEKELSHNLYLDAMQAKEFGIIDIVGVPRLNEIQAFELTVLNGTVPIKKPKKTKKKK